MEVGDLDRRLDQLWELRLVEAYWDSLIKHHAIKLHVGVEVQLHTVFSLD
jgi:predicted transcriptional regulator